MSESSSVSKGPIVAKILIDLSEYIVLKKAKQRQEENEDHLSKSYEEKVVTQQPMDEENEQKEEEKSSAAEKAVSPIQVGNGVDFKQLIQEALAEGLKSLVQNKIPSQIGGSFVPTISNLRDLAPPPPQTLPVEDHQPPSGLEILLKSDENDLGDEASLLTKIPPKFRARGQQLLQAFNENSASISWNSDGIVFINGESVPLSNIFTLLPELFKTHPNKELPGFYELVKQLASLGLGHLINNHILKGLRRNGPLENQTQLLNYIQQYPGKWYFLG